MECKYAYAASKVTYCSITGKFTRKDGEDIVKSKQGYLKLYGLPAHRVAWYIHHKSIPDKPVDHINRIRDDNRISNLRLATVQENGRNSSKHTTGQKGRGFTSKYKGVRKLKTNKKNPWQTRIRYEVGGLDKSLGCYRTEEEAALAYDRAALEYFGEYASINFPCNTPRNKEILKVTPACNPL